AGIKLQARFRSRDIKCSPALWIDKASRRLKTAARAIQYPVVIVPAPAFQLDVVRVYARANRCRLLKIERCPLYGGEFTGRDQRRIDRCITAGMNRQFVTKNVAAIRSQIEVAVLGQVDGRRL